MYFGVPMSMLAVAADPSKIFAIPKSVTLSKSPASNMMLSGLMSRCSTPWLCAQVSAAAAARPTAQAPSGEIPVRRRLSVPPPSNSMTIRCRSSAST